MIEAVLPHGCEGRSLHRVPSGPERVGAETQHPLGLDPAPRRGATCTGKKCPLLISTKEVQRLGGKSAL